MDGRTLVGGAIDGRADGWMGGPLASPQPEPLPHAVKDWECHYLLIVFAAEACSTGQCCFQDPPYPDADSGLGQLPIVGRGHAWF